MCEKEIWEKMINFIFNFLIVNLFIFILFILLNAKEMKEIDISKFKKNYPFSFIQFFP